MRFGIVISFMLMCAGAVLPQTKPQPLVVELKATGLNRAELPVVKYNDSIYIPVNETFTFLGIQFDDDTIQNRLSGFYKQEDSTYIIDFTDSLATRARHKIHLTGNESFRIDGQRYLQMDFFNKFFNLDFVFIKRKLQITVTKTGDLPGIIEKRRLRALARRQKTQIPSPEVFVPTELWPVNGGRITWQSTEHFGKIIYPRSHQYADLGVKTFGMDYSAQWNYELRRNYHKSVYLNSLRYPLFTNNYLRQITLGDYVDYGIQAQQIRGVQFTNRPAALRHVFSQEVFQGVVEPKMNVTINNAVSDAVLQIADDEGKYEYDVPVLYGNGIMEIQAFDMWGRQRTFRYRMNIPRSLLPESETEYFLSMGKVRNQKYSVLSGSFDYGVSSEFTVGTKFSGYDYKYQSKFFPSITNTVLITHGLILNDFVAPNALSRANLSLEFPSSALISLTATKYARNTIFNLSNISHDIEGTITLPIFLRENAYTFNAFGSSTRYSTFRTDEYQLAIAAMIRGASSSVGFRFVEERHDAEGIPTLIKQTNASINISLPGGVNALVAGVYDHLLHKMNEVQGSLLKSVSSMFKFSLSYLRFFPYPSYNVQFNLFAYLPFARTNASVMSNHAGRYEYNIVSSGSCYFDVVNPSVSFMNDRANAFSSGGFYLRPFVDTNNNGTHDRGEQFIESGRVYLRNTALKSGLLSLQANRPYRQGISNYDIYDIYLDPKSLEDPLLVPKHGVMEVQAQPNYIRRIDIPLVTGGVVRGIVQVTKRDTVAPIEGVTVVIKNIQKEQDSTKFIRTMETFSTGEYEFIGIPPGEYLISVDKKQLERLSANANPLVRRVTVMLKPEGDLIVDQNFKLSAR